MAVNYVLFSAGGGEVWRTSVDGTTWTSIAEIGSANRCLWLDNYSRWVAIGTSAAFISDDPDAVTWSDVTPSGWGGSSSVDMDYDPLNDVLVAMSDSGIFKRSVDGGSTWADPATPPSGSVTFRSVHWDADFALWFIPSEDGTGTNLWTSPDGNIWTNQSHLNTSGGGTNYKQVSIEGAVLSIGTASNSNGVLSTTNGTSQTNLGNLLNSEALNADFDGTYVGTTGTSGSNKTFQRSLTGASGSWESIVVGTTTTLGLNREVRADPTRGKWWAVYRKRLFWSEDSGSTWTDSGLTTTFVNGLGIKPDSDPVYAPIWQIHEYIR